MQICFSRALVKPVLVASLFAMMGLSNAQATPITGLASFYKHGVRTANGEAFDPHGLTAAHRSLPFGTRVKVMNVSNGRSVIVRINDRGPFVRGRIIDLSLGAAQVLDLVDQGVDKVRIEVLGKPDATLASSDTDTR